MSVTSSSLSLLAEAGRRRTGGTPPRLPERKEETDSAADQYPPSEAEAYSSPADA